MKSRDQMGLSEQEFLAEYNPDDYPRPSVAADVVIFTIADAPENNYRKLPEKELRVLLIRRGIHPYLDHWALPGGFVRPTETVDEAAHRELLEETGVTGGYLEQLYTFSDPNRDPRTWVMSCAHMALMDSRELQVTAGDDASEAQWFRLDYVPSEKTGMRQESKLTLTSSNALLSATVERVGDQASVGFKITKNNGLAFDHAKIIACAVERLRGKLEYTDLAFNLLAETFTLTELQQVYEVILGKPLLKAAFRRKIHDLVQETGEYTENAGHRPSQLFRRRQKEQN